MTSALAEMVAEAAEIVVPEPEPVYPEIPEHAWVYAHTCPVCAHINIDWSRWD